MAKVDKRVSSQIYFAVGSDMTCVITLHERENLQFSETGVGVIATSLLDLILGKLVLAGEDTPRDGVEGVKANVIVLKAREELGCDRTGNRVVHSLVNRWTDVSVLLANLVDLGYVPGRVVRQTELIWRKDREESSEKRSRSK